MGRGLIHESKDVVSMGQQAGMGLTQEKITGKSYFGVKSFIILIAKKQTEK